MKQSVEFVHVKCRVQAHVIPLLTVDGRVLPHSRLYDAQPTTNAGGDSTLRNPPYRPQTDIMNSEPWIFEMPRYEQMRAIHLKDWYLDHATA